MSGLKTLQMDPSVTATQWTEQARQTWARMGERVGALVRYYGEGSEQARAAAMSFVQVASSIVGWGDVRVAQDGDLSLFCRSDGIVFGIIWHEARRRCTNEGCKGWLNPEGKVYTFNALDPLCEGPHVPDIPMDAPLPGTWSFHS